MLKTIIPTTAFRKDLKRCSRSGRHDLDLLKDIIHKTANGKSLDAKYRDHPLDGDYSDCRECHIKPDWLLIYRYTDSELFLIRLGSHTELFD